MQSSSSASSKTTQSDVKVCYRCNGKGNVNDKCQMKSIECYLCHKKGKIANACRSKKQGDFEKNSGATGTENTKYQKQATLQVEEKEVCSLYSLGSQDAIQVNITAAGRELELIVDTSATVTVIPKKTYEKQLSHVKLQSSNVKLQSYCRQTLSVRGEAVVPVRNRDQQIRVE